MTEEKEKQSFSWNWAKFCALVVDKSFLISFFLLMSITYSLLVNGLADVAGIFRRVYSLLASRPPELAFKMPFSFVNLFFLSSFLSSFPLGPRFKRARPPPTGLREEDKSTTESRACMNELKKVATWTKNTIKPFPTNCFLECIYPKIASRVISKHLATMERTKPEGRKGTDRLLCCLNPDPCKKRRWRRMVDALTMSFHTKYIKVI